jgi:hypothetical protein
VKRKLIVFLTFLASAMVPVLGAVPYVARPAWAACESGEKPDKTTVEDTRKLLTKAGYKDARDWRKGCDNTWHATAMKDGTRVSVAVLPDGHVVQEGD